MISPERFPRIATSAVVSGSWYGPTITASGTIHTKGSWTSLIASLGFHAFLCGVIIGEAAVATTDTSMLVDIGYDPAGGTTYGVEIPNVLAGFTPTSVNGPPRVVYFPVSIPKGSQVAARCQALIVSDVARVGVILLGGKNRSNPFPHRGAIQDYGTSTATSGGTAMAAATADTKSTWTQLGADTTRRHSGLVVAVSGADTSMTGDRFLLDIGIDPAGATAFGVVIPDIPLFGHTGEEIAPIDPLSCLASIDIPSGSAIGARAAASAGNGGANVEVAVYGF